MPTSFDLISDLHIETWDEKLNWKNLATSLACVVAGDVSRDPDIIVETLQELGQAYKTVLYIDGNDEHRWNLHDLPDHYNVLSQLISEIPNIHYLRDTVAVIDGVGFVGVNGWWTYDFDTPESYTNSRRWFEERYKVGSLESANAEALAMTDAKYLNTTIKNLQIHNDIEHLVIVSHTVPSPELISHDIELEGTHMLNCAGNAHLISALNEDTEAKVHTWCFGHYHNDINTMFKGIRFLNNCRGRGGTNWSKSVYYPKKIVIS